MEAIAHRFEMNQDALPEDICDVCVYAVEYYSNFPCAACTLNPDHAEEQKAIVKEK